MKFELGLLLDCFFHDCKLNYFGVKTGIIEVWVYQSLVYSFSNFSMYAFYRLLLLTIYYCCLAYFEMLVTPIISTQIP